MPSGRTHDRITLWSLPLVAAVSLAATKQSPLTLSVCAGFLFGGLMLGPDLDIHSIHYKRWGWLRWIWIPYRGSMRHRSPLSHAPITGTTIRVIYLMLWLSLAVLAVIAIANELWHFGWTWAEVGQVFGWYVSSYQTEIFALCIGLELGAFSHYSADWLVSTYKRGKSKGWKAIFTKSTKRRGQKHKQRTK